MRRPLILLAASVGVLLLGGFLFRAWHEHRASRPEFTLSDGTVIQVEGLTWGTNQVLRLVPPLWSETLKRLPPVWQQRLGGVPPERRSGGDMANLWLTHLDPVRGNFLGPVYGQLTSFDSAGTPTTSGRGFSSSGGRANQALGCELLDWRADSLRFEFKFGATTHSFTLPNPRRGEPFPEWPALPLPQTVAAAPFALTLHAVQQVSSRALDWRSDVSVTKDGTNVSRWFNLDRQFVDPTGNRHWTRLPPSEPVWGVEVTAYPSAEFPFPAEQAVRLGTLRVPAAGEFVTTPAGSELTNACLHWAGLLGPGNFSFRGGTNTAASPKFRNGGSSTSLGDDWRASLDAEEPRLVLFLRGSTAGGALLAKEGTDSRRLIVRGRRSDGTVIEGTGRSYTSSNDGQRIDRLQEFSLPAARPGENLELDLFLASPLQARFTFAAPNQAQAR